MTQGHAYRRHLGISLVTGREVEFIEERVSFSRSGDIQAEVIAAAMARDARAVTRRPEVGR